MREIKIRIEGRPPPKSEAKSLFAQGGRYEQRVRALLEAAHAEIARVAFEGFGQARIKLEVQIHTGPAEPPWDATNYLGGIADVLEGKAKRSLAQPGSLTHLGTLSDVGLYDDDRQIKQIVYREVEHPKSEYLVTLSALDGGSQTPPIRTPPP